jgi:hypothetical protein
VETSLLPEVTGPVAVWSIPGKCISRRTAKVAPTTRRIPTSAIPPPPIRTAPRQPTVAQATECSAVRNARLRQRRCTHSSSKPQAPNGLPDASDTMVLSTILPTLLAATKTLRTPTCATCAKQRWRHHIRNNNGTIDNSTIIF